jgi:hypothetical protein
MRNERLILMHPPNLENAHVTEQASKPPPAGQERKAPPLVRPDRQLTYDGVSHNEWPDPNYFHDGDTIRGSNPKRYCGT